MKKLIKFIFYLVMVCAALLIIAVIGLHMYMKSYIKKPEFTKMIVAQIENATHRKAEFKGIDYSIMPLSFILNDVAVKNRDNTGNFVALKKLDVKINPFKGEVTNVILDSPELNVTQFRDGSFDFSDMISGAKPETTKETTEPVTNEASPEKPVSEAKPISLPVDLNIALVQIKNAVLHYKKEDSSGNIKSFDVPGFDLAIKNISLERQVDMELKIKIGTKSSIEITTGIGPVKTIPPDIANLNLILKGDIRISLKDLEAFIPQETLKSIPVTDVFLNWNGKGTLASGFSFDFNVSTPQISGANTLETKLETGLRVDIPATVLEDIMKGKISPAEIQKKIKFIFTGKLDIKTELVPSHTLSLNCPKFQLDVNQDQLKVEDFVFSHKDTALRFNMEVSGLNPNVSNPKITMNLTSDMIVVHELLKAVSPEKPEAVNPQSQAAASESAPATTEAQPQPAAEQKELDLRGIPFLDKIILNAEVMLKKTVYEKNIITDLKTSLTLKNGVMNLNPLSLNIFDGLISDVAEVNLLAYPITYTNQFKIDQLDVNKACQANMEEANYYGRLQADFSASGTGTTTPSLKQNLLSKGNVTLKDGKMISKGGSMEDKVYLALDNPIVIQAMPKLQPKIETARLNQDKTSETLIKELLFSYTLESGKMVLEGFQMGTPEYFLTAGGDMYPFDDKIDMQARINFSEKATRELTDGEDMSDRLPYENNGLVFPLAINGQLSSPTPLPDIAFITKNLAAKQLAKQLGKFLGGDETKAEGGTENKTKDLGKALGGLFGK